MRIKHLIAFGMVTAVLITTISGDRSQAAQGSKHSYVNLELDQAAAEVKNKSEVVYAKLAAEGTTTAVYVVNYFEVEKDGSITDYGNYQTVQNLTDVKPMVLNGDAVSFEANEGNYYYQGNTKSTDLPWNFDITYSLDGVVVSPSDLAGKSGELEIQIHSTPNDKVDKAFYEHYMLQLSFTLDNEKTSDINALGAVIAKAGNQTILNFTVMPNIDADFKVTAKVKDFSMSGIEITGMPFAMNIELPDTASMLGEFDKLPAAVSELNQGVASLADGTFKLSQGAKQIKNSSLLFNNGLAELDLNSNQLSSASTQINEALQMIATALSNNPNMADLSEITKLPKVLTGLADNIEKIAGGMGQLGDGYQAANTALDLAITQLPDVAITKEELHAQFPDADETQQQLLDQLYQSYATGQTVKGTYANGKEVFAQIGPTIENLSTSLVTIAGALDEISSKMNSSLSDTDLLEQLGELNQGLTDLANKYSAFDKGLKEYFGGVGKLAKGYQQFDLGLIEFVNGIGTLNQGVSTLYEGTQQFYQESSNLPAMIQEEIDKVTQEYTGSKFEDRSFVSSKNTNTGLVQFVIKCEDIKLQETTDTTVAEDVKEEETVLDRFVALFVED